MKVFLDCCALMDFFQGRKNGERIETILPVTSDDISSAIARSCGDFEDAVECACAKHVCDCIVTENVKDFSISSIEVYSPEEFKFIK